MAEGLAAATPPHTPPHTRSLPTPHSGRRAIHPQEHCSSLRRAAISQLTSHAILRLGLGASPPSWRARPVSLHTHFRSHAGQNDPTPCQTPHTHAQSSKGRSGGNHGGRVGAAPAQNLQHRLSFAASQKWSTCNIYRCGMCIVWFVCFKGRVIVGNIGAALALVRPRP